MIDRKYKQLTCRILLRRVNIDAADVSGSVRAPVTCDKWIFKWDMLAEPKCLFLSNISGARTKSLNANHKYLKFLNLLKGQC